MCVVLVLSNLFNAQHLERGKVKVNVTAGRAAVIMGHSSQACVSSYTSEHCSVMLVTHSLHMFFIRIYE